MPEGEYWPDESMDSLVTLAVSRLEETTSRGCWRMSGDGLETEEGRCNSRDYINKLIPSKYKFIIPTFARITS